MIFKFFFIILFSLNVFHGKNILSDTFKKNNFKMSQNDIDKLNNSFYQFLDEYLPKYKNLCKLLKSYQGLSLVLAQLILGFCSNYFFKNKPKQFKIIHFAILSGIAGMFFFSFPPKELLKEFIYLNLISCSSGFALGYLYDFIKKKLNPKKNLKVVNENQYSQVSKLKSSSKMIENSESDEYAEYASQILVNTNAQGQKLTKRNMSGNLKDRMEIILKANCFIKKLLNDLNVQNSNLLKRNIIINSNISTNDSRGGGNHLQFVQSQSDSECRELQIYKNGNQKFMTKRGNCGSEPRKLVLPLSNEKNYFEEEEGDQKPKKIQDKTKKKTEKISWAKFLNKQKRIFPMKLRQNKKYQYVYDRVECLLKLSNEQFKNQSLAEHHLIDKDENSQMQLVSIGQNSNKRIRYSKKLLEEYVKQNLEGRQDLPQFTVTFPIFKQSPSFLKSFEYGQDHLRKALNNLKCQESKNHDGQIVRFNYSDCRFHKEWYQYNLYHHYSFN